MTRTSEIDQAEYDRWAKASCPRLVKRCTWMHGDIRQPLKVTGPKRASVKVPAADRRVYEACAAAMLDGRLWSFVIDPKTGRFQVQWTEGGEWVEVWRHDLAAHLGEPAPVVAVPKVKAVKVAPAVIESMAPVVGIRSGTSMPGPVADYLARLVFEPKRVYATALAAHLLHPMVAPLPADPGTGWADKVRVKLARLVPAAGVVLEAVAS